MWSAVSVRSQVVHKVAQIGTSKVCGRKRGRMGDTETNLPEELALDSHKARRHSDIRVFSGSATPNVAEVALEEVTVCSRCV